jgi:hypothetical protein
MHVPLAYTIKIYSLFRERMTLENLVSMTQRYSLTAALCSPYFSPFFLAVVLFVRVFFKKIFAILQNSFQILYTI